MSKKMMKRSLALGALMAFVITGSAMAAEPIIAKDKSHAFSNNTSTRSQDVVKYQVMAQREYNEDDLIITVIGTSDNNGITAFGKTGLPKSVKTVDGTMTITVDNLNVTGSTSDAIMTQYDGKLTMNIAKSAYVNSYGDGISSGAQSNANIVINASTADITVIAG